jgi:pantothenate kinase
MIQIKNEKQINKGKKNMTKLIQKQLYENVGSKVKCFRLEARASKKLSGGNSVDIKDLKGLINLLTIFKNTTFIRRSFMNE